MPIGLGRVVYGLMGLVPDGHVDRGWRNTARRGETYIPRWINKDYVTQMSPISGIIFGTIWYCSSSGLLLEDKKKFIKEPNGARTESFKIYRYSGRRLE